MVWVKLDDEFIQAVMKNVAAHLDLRGFLLRPEDKMQQPGSYYHKYETANSYYTRAYIIGPRTTSYIHISGERDGFEVETAMGPNAGRKLRLTAKRAEELGVGPASVAVNEKVDKKLNELAKTLRAEEITARADAEAVKALKERFKGWIIARRHDPRHYCVRRREPGAISTRASYEPAPAGTNEVRLNVLVDFDYPGDDCKVVEITVTEILVKKNAGLTRRAMADVLAEIKF